MSKIHIEHAHCLTKEEARERLAPLIKSMGDKYGASTNWISDVEVEFSRTGIRGQVTIDDGVVRVEMSLSHAMSPLTGTIKHHVNGWLSRLMGPIEPPAEKRMS